MLVRERGLAMAEAARENPGSMAAILGLDDAVVEALCAEIADVWPANYNCPGQIVISGKSPAVDECCSEAEARRRPTDGEASRVSGAFHSPLVARAAERLRPAIDTGEVQRPDRAVHVHGHGEDRARAADGLAARRPADRAGAASHRRRAS